MLCYVNEGVIIFSGYFIIYRMQRHFNFGHTIVPKEQQSDSDNLLDLFKIGQERIIIPKKQEEISEDEDDSDRTVRNKKIKKENKQKKEKKQKKEHKHKHKQKKEKQKKIKQKKEKKRRESSSQSFHHQSKQQIVPFNPARKAELLQKYAKALDTKTIDQKLDQTFELKLKLGEGMLNIDIIRFPQMRLFQYGPMDKEIPRYQRLPDFYNIIGFKKSKHKKAAKIIRKLNKMINQHNPRPFSDQISKDRYFHFEGYEHTGLQRLAVEKHQIASEALMKFNLQQGTAGNQEEAVLKATRQFNKRLHQNPKNIELWLQFVGLQERFSLSVGTLKNRTAVIDRKLSILEKALQLNPANQRLGLLRLNCLFEKQADHKAMASQCLQLIKENPWSVGLWKFYFKMSIERFGSYSHALLRRTFQQMSELLRRAIEKTKSAVQIWKMRKAALEVTRSMVLVYKLEGFCQLATGMIVALLDYNIFMTEAATTLTRPQEKLYLFQNYWEDCSVYKLGQSSKGSTWSNLVKFIGNQDGFIGNYESPNLSKERVPILQQMRESERLWRISNANWDQKKIQENPESFVLYEDIEFAMMLYRDSDSTTALIDALADHLQLPLVFSATSAYSQFGLKVLERALKQAIQSKHQLNWFSFDRQGYNWAQYWNPVFTDKFLSEQALIKMEYMRRVLLQAKKKMQTKITQINQYLSFIACAVYLSPFAQKVLKISEQQELSHIEQILQEEPLNLATWSMYIEATFIKMHNTQECLNCYLQLFETAQKMSQSKENLFQMQIQILLWMCQFNKRYNLGKGRVLLKILKLIVMNEADQNFNLQRQINVFDCLQLEQYFRIQTQKMANNLLSKETKESVISRCRASIFIHYYLDEFPSSSLEELSEKTTLLLIGQLDSNGNSKNNLFIIKILTSFRLLNHQYIAKYQLLTLFPFSTLLQYWVSFAKKPFFLLVAEFEEMSQRPLALWMTISAFLWRNRIGEGYMFDYFSTIAKKVCFQQRFCDQKPEFITLLCELLAYDTEDHSKFIMFSLQHLPFSKKLYLLNLLLTGDTIERRKLATIIEEKGIRILNHQILE